MSEPFRVAVGMVLPIDPQLLYILRQLTLHALSEDPVEVKQYYLEKIAERLDLDLTAYALDDIPD